MNKTTGELFVNTIFLTVNYIKEILNMVKSYDVEEKIMYKLYYITINQTIDYINSVFCDINVLKRDAHKNNHYILFSRMFLKRMLGLKEIPEKTYKCQLKKFLLKNIENSTLMFLYGRLKLKEDVNTDISSDLIERTIQAIELHYF